MDLKPSKTHAQQLELMKERGLIIEDKELAVEVLQNVNYYVLSGYLHGFKKKDGTYQEGLSFERIHMLYKFDCRLKNILLYAIENIEQALKTKIAYALAMAYKDCPNMYESEDLFKNKDDHKRFMKSFCWNVRNNLSVPFVHHHVQKYGGHFPIWVAVELLTLGNIKYLYKNIPNKVRRTVSRELDESPVVLDSWIENLRCTRNTLAHDMRLYDMSFRFTPMLSEKHHKYREVTNRIFDHIYLIKILYCDKDEWKNIVAEIKELLQAYSAHVNPVAIGFPDNWETILLQE